MKFHTDLFAFYGSLRRGMVNYVAYRHSMDFMFCAQIKGYSLYSFGEYPYAVKTGDKVDQLTVEVFKITNPVISREIYELEISANYFLDYVDLAGATVGIYLFEKVGNHPKVKSGDWVDFFGSREK